MRKEFYAGHYFIISDKDYKTFNFSGGEVHVELNRETLDTLERIEADVPILLNVRVTSSDKLMQLIILNDIFKRYKRKVSCLLKYIPYARQDRETIEYGATSLKVFASLINACEFEQVFVLDPHSIVSENVINNVSIISIYDTLEHFVRNVDEKKEIQLLSPDLGAVKRTTGALNHLLEAQRRNKYKISDDILIAHKERNPATGAIDSVKIIGETPVGKHIIVIDDICDGGATFVKLLEATKLHENNRVDLWVTHGIFSKGTKPLFDAGYTNIGMTDSVISFDAWREKYAQEYQDKKLRFFMPRGNCD